MAVEITDTGVRDLDDHEESALAPEPQHLSESLIERLDKAIGDAVRAVRYGGQTDARVAFSVSLKRETDPEKETFGDIDVTFSLTGNSAMKGKIALLGGQLRLKF